jgi:hypothetical protein
MVPRETQEDEKGMETILPQIMTRFRGKWRKWIPFNKTKVNYNKESNEAQKNTLKKKSCK